MEETKGLPARALDVIKRGIGIFTEKNMPVFAGNSTLFIVTALFPFVMLIISVINLLPGYSAEDVSGLLFRLLPDLEPIEKLVGSVISNLKDQSNGLLASIAAVTTLWSASKGVSAIQKGLNQLNKEDAAIEKKEESLALKPLIGGFAKDTLKRVLFTLLLVILIPAMLVFQMLEKSIMGVIGDVIERLSPDSLETLLPDIDSIFQTGSLVVMVFAVLVIIAIYALLPSKHRSFRSCLPGAILTCVCWFAFTKLFSLFMPWIFNASIYGSLASLFLMFLWLWVMVMILFAGGVLNRSLDELR